MNNAGMAVDVYALGGSLVVRVGFGIAAGVLAEAALYVGNAVGSAAYATGWANADLW